jgi:hypothetical protein
MVYARWINVVGLVVAHRYCVVVVAVNALESQAEYDRESGKQIRARMWAMRVQSSVVNWALTSSPSSRLPRGSPESEISTWNAKWRTRTAREVDHYSDVHCGG